MSELGAAREAASSPAEISLVDLAIAIAKRKWIVIGLPIAFAVVAAIYSLLVTPVFTATTKILPPQYGQSAGASVMSQLGGLVGLPANVLKDPSQVYIAMLRSRTVADSLITRFDLMKRFDKQYQSQARKALEGATRVDSGKDGLITVEVDDTDPKFAAELANAYVDELFKLSNTLAVTESSQRRLFFEQQLKQARDNLVKAEHGARQALERGGLVKVDDQGRAFVETAARLRAEITAKEVQIGVMRTFATEDNPDLRRAQQELASMQRGLQKLEGTNAGPAPAPGKDNNTQGFDSLRVLREVKYYEVLYELLAKQYEVAKIDEAKNSSVLQVLDKAVEPDMRSRPERRRIVMFGAGAGLVAALLLALLLEAIERARQDPVSHGRIALLVRHLRLR